MPGFGFINGPVLVAGGAKNLFQAIGSLGQGTDLEAAWDVGAFSSWPGSGGLWRDLTGNARHLFFGSSSGSDSNEAIFNGLVNSLSAAEYWRAQANDYFEEAQTMPWKNTMGVSTPFTIGAMVWMDGGASGFKSILFDSAAYNSGVNSYQGTEIAITGDASNMQGMMRGVSYIAGNPSHITKLTSILSAKYNQWVMIGVRFDKNDSGGAMMINTSEYSLSGTWFSATNKESATRLWNDRVVNVNSGARLAWQFQAKRKWTAAEWQALYQEMRTNRFTSLP